MFVIVLGLKESKLVQTDAVSAFPIEAPAYPLELEYPNTDPELEKQTSLVNWVRNPASITRRFQIVQGMSLLEPFS